MYKKTVPAYWYLDDEGKEKVAKIQVEAQDWAWAQPTELSQITGFDVDMLMTAWATFVGLQEVLVGLEGDRFRLVSFDELAQMIRLDKDNKKWLSELMIPGKVASSIVKTYENVRKVVEILVSIVMDSEIGWVNWNPHVRAPEFFYREIWDRLTFLRSTIQIRVDNTIQDSDFITINTGVYDYGISSDPVRLELLRGMGFVFISKRIYSREGAVGEILIRRRKQS